MPHLVLVKNAFANICRGGATALVSILLPPFLTRILSKDAYGTWLLILQLSTYVSFLDFGIQTAVGRYVAQCNELGDIKQRNSIVSTAVAILTVLGMLAVVGISILSWQLPYLFKDMPVDLHQDAQLALLLVGVSLSISLPLNTFGGIFIGFQRYDIPAWIIGSSKIIGAIFVVIIAKFTNSIVWMAVVFSIANFCTYLWMFLAYKKLLKSVDISRKFVKTESAKELLSYCSVFLIWSIGTLLVSGLDTTIVGYFDYKSVGYYAVSSNIVALIAGLQSSAFSSLMPVAAASIDKDPKILGNLLISSTKISIFTSMIFGLVLFAFGREILTTWIGVDYANNSILMLRLLIVANVIRSSLIPYSILLLGTGEQNLVKKSPVVEGVANLLVSVTATYLIGSYGVAIGTIVGAITLWLMCIFDNMPRTSKIHFDRGKFINQALLRPITSIAIPTIIVYNVSYVFSENTNLVVLLVWSIVSFLIFALSILSIGISRAERIQIFLVAKKIVGH